MLAVTAAVSVVALLDTRLSGQLIRDEPLVRAGQWWRLVTPVLVQPDGWGQFVFNLAGIAVVGAALERRRPPWFWCTVYLSAGVGSILILTALIPADHGGGSSDCVAGLIGALVVTEVRRRSPSTGWLAATAAAYSAFFCAYLTFLDLAGVWPAMIAGDLAVAILLTARRHAGVARTEFGLLVLAGVAGVVMALQPDGHGIGLLVGAALAVMVGPDPSGAVPAGGQDRDRRRREPRTERHLMDVRMPQWWKVPGSSAHQRAGREDGGHRMERDRDERGRARNSRNRDRLGRLLPRGAEGVVPLAEDDLLAMTPAESLDAAQRLLDEGFPFQAHEVLEAAWKTAPPDLRSLWQGIAQVAVGVTHAERGNIDGAVTLLHRGAANIDRCVVEIPYDIDVAGLQHWIRSTARHLTTSTGSHVDITTPRLCRADHEHGNSPDRTREASGDEHAETS